MYSEDDLLPLSALQHLLFCERQCALIHVEGLWADNDLTVQGTHLHRRVDRPGTHEDRQDVITARGLSVRSRRLGLTGRADVVEFRSAPDGLPGTVLLANRSGRWTITPVEYKRGQPKQGYADEIQLCAQAMGLEEMTDGRIELGYLFYGAMRRRYPVDLTEPLRLRTTEAAARLHALVRSGRTPPAQRDPRCEHCSLVGLCMPEATTTHRSARSYFQQELGRLSVALEDT